MAAREPLPEDFQNLTKPGNLSIQHAGILTYGGSSIRLLDQMASAGGGVLFFSLGRSERSVAADLLCCRAGVGLGESEKTSFTPEELMKLKKLGKEIYAEKIYIDDRPELTLESLERTVRKHKDVRYVILDSIELMDSPMKTEGRIKGFAKLVIQLRLKARQLGVAIVAFRRPMLFHPG